MISYINGNVKVTIQSDGTKIREYIGIPVIRHPESIDIKITDYCDLGCAFCHESSTVAGKHGDLDNLIELLRPLPAGVEIAIGGGNPLSHPRLEWFLRQLHRQGLIANLTINQGHISKYLPFLLWIISKNLVKGIGVSITSKDFNSINKLRLITPNIVYHVIAGVHKPSILDHLTSYPNSKILVLGYKQYGFGKKFYSPKIEDNIQDWYRQLPKYTGKGVLAFDNLAIEQLNIRRLFTDDGWDKFYMGDDFVYTMYYDAVKQEFAPTSRSDRRISSRVISLLDFFKTRNEK